MSDECIPQVIDVRALITTALSDAQVAVIILDMQLLSEVCISGYACSRQIAIIKYLTAHAISFSAGHGAKTQMQLGDASESYATAIFGDMLKGTTYGQMAMMLDTNGCLAKLGKRAAKFDVL
jgi:hypothetical protein